MRHRERMKIDFADAKVFTGINLDHAISQSISAPARLVAGDVATFADVSIARLCRHEDGAVEILHQHAQAARVIAVLMSNQNAIKRIWIFAEKRHAASDFARAEAGVNQDSSAVGD